jgi:ADP-dependent phosphofructokinase/glucokinase
MWMIMMATAKAAFGNYGSDAEVRWVLEQPFSETGLRNLDIIQAYHLEERVVLVPTFYIDKPKYTIGLGDSFTGGMQLCF